MLETKEEQYGFYVNLLDFLKGPLGLNYVELVKEKLTEWETRLESIVHKMEDPNDYAAHQSDFLKIKGYIRIYKELLGSELFDIENCRSLTEMLKKEIKIQE